MSITALSFSYNGVDSEDYGLYIGEINPSSVKNTMASTNTEFIQDFLPTRSENFIYGVRQSERNLTFKIKLFSYDFLSKNDVSYIDNWLFSNKQPKRLMFMQEDMATYSYMAIFEKNEIISVGNKIIGFECDIICDSSYAIEQEKTEVYQVNSAKDVSVRFNNLSGGINYLYPKIEWTCNKDNGSLQIVNKNDNNRTFIITGLRNGEKITIDRYFQIKSSMGLLRSENCNKKWLRFVNGINNFTVKGDTSNLYITYQFKKAIGA